jgi:hypothetical protein
MGGAMNRIHFVIAVAAAVVGVGVQAQGISGYKTSGTSLLMNDACASDGSFCANIEMSTEVSPWSDSGVCWSLTLRYPSGDWRWCSQCIPPGPEIALTATPGHAAGAFTASVAAGCPSDISVSLACSTNGSAWVKEITDQVVQTPNITFREHTNAESRDAASCTANLLNRTIQGSGGYWLEWGQANEIDKSIEAPSGWVDPTGTGPSPGGLDYQSFVGVQPEFPEGSPILEFQAAIYQYEENAPIGSIFMVLRDRNFNCSGAAGDFYINKVRAGGSFTLDSGDSGCPIGESVVVECVNQPGRSTVSRSLYHQNREGVEGDRTIRHFSGFGVGGVRCSVQGLGLSVTADEIGHWSVDRAFGKDIK